MADDVSIRSHLVAALEGDLVGPFDPAVPDEVLSLPPSRWYLTGFLAPVAARETHDPTAEDDGGNGPEQDDEETSAPEAAGRRGVTVEGSSLISQTLEGSSEQEYLIRIGGHFSPYGE